MTLDSSRSDVKTEGCCSSTDHWPADVLVDCGLSSAGFDLIEGVLSVMFSLLCAAFADRMNPSLE